MGMKENCSKLFVVAVLLGVILIICGLFLPMPSDALTTYSVYRYNNEYTVIDEYVGGDAYNYIIGASLVAGKISGTITTKAVLITGGIICICIGLLIKEISKLCVKLAVIHGAETDT